MSPDPELAPGSIHVEHLWKRFKPDVTGNLLAYEMGRFKDRLLRRPVDWTYALREINLEIEPGEAVGLIGSNGSGKSTLLKLIGGIMYPYAGAVSTVGRIGALIEVRAGIQPLLSGRENIYLYATLLGLSRRQVTERFDRIVAFAQLEDAVDRPVKFYSSGMQMRLGFSVAAFLDPAIMLVDEVLAVGDADFQQRCLDRLREVVQDGTTVIFVSHDLPSVAAISERVVWLEKGVVRADGESTDVISEYRSHVEQGAARDIGGARGVRLSDVTVRHPDGTTPTTQEPIEISMQLKSEIGVEHGRVFVGVTEGTADPMLMFSRDIIPMTPGQRELRLNIPRLPLPRGKYYLWAGVDRMKTRGIDQLVDWSPVGQFTVAGPKPERVPLAVVLRAPIHAASTWEESPIRTGNGA